MTGLTLDHEEAGLSAAVWNWLQYTGHFTCGGWSWDSRKPGELLCARGVNLMAAEATPLTYVYSLHVTYPPRWLEPGWEPPGREPGYTVGSGGDDDELYQFRWPQNRLCRTLGTAKRRADLFRKYGAHVTITRSLPVEWPSAGDAPC